MNKSDVESKERAERVNAALDKMEKEVDVTGSSAELKEALSALRAILNDPNLSDNEKRQWLAEFHSRTSQALKELTNELKGKK